MSFNSLDLLLARRHTLAKGVAALLALFVLAAGAGEPAEKTLRLIRDGIRSQPASGAVHIVEIDARSLREIDRWPWPRRFHGQLIDRLHAAKVRSIAFDVDFSSSSRPEEDAVLARALERADGSVILPTFRQHEGAGSSDYLDNLPIKPFRDHAFLAAVTVHPGTDGYVRHMPLGIETASTPRPSLASLVAEQTATIGRSFEIDYSIEPSSIPRHSFVDLINGRTDLSLLAGKRIIVGATAVEMGDRYAAPGHGVIPGVVIQAIAAETLLRGRVPDTVSAWWSLLLASLIILATVRPGARKRRVALFVVGGLSLLAVPLATEQFLALNMPLAPALVALMAAGGLSLVFHFAERFRHRAFFDRETGMRNLAALERDCAGSEAKVVVARIDRFAAIASGLGAQASVALLHRVADRLAFGRENPVYRIDEASLAWLEGDENLELAERLDSLVALMRSPVDCGRLVDVSLSFGVAEPVPAGAKQQISDAALAAVQAIRQGRRWTWFTETNSDEASWHLSLLGELDAAMAAGQVWNAYQPKLDLRAGRICGVEALVRWNHVERGPISPDQFIPLVEEHGRARDLTYHVFDRAVEDARAWAAMGQPLIVAVNVSATLLLDDIFVRRLRDTLLEAGLAPGRITIEVTESAAMMEQDRAIAALESWREAGANISIDDYGTGQSSLGYLQKLPASELKIDMSFVTDIVSNERNAIMARSTIALAHELGMTVVAEGVEDQACLDKLVEMGCDSAQGWHVGRPMPADALIDFLSRSSRKAA